MKKIEIDKSELDATAQAESEKAVIERKKGFDVPKKSTRLQNLTTISFMAVCIVLGLIILKVFTHASIMSKYEIPDEFYLMDIKGEENETEENVEYIEEVTYNPSEAGHALAKAQNEYVSGADLLGERLWLSSKLNYTWSFKSGYEYRSAKIDCIWICTEDQTGDVLAIHTATYDGGTDTFINGKTQVTHKGVGHLAAD